MKDASFQLSPLAAWLVLAGCLATLFPLKLEQLEIILISVALLSLLWLPKKRTRSAPLLLLYAASAVLALKLPLPLTASWHPLAQLLFILFVWASLLCVILSILFYYFFLTAAGQGTKQHTGQRHRQ